MSCASLARPSETKKRSFPYASFLPCGSPCTGTMPRPRLPVLSATSCSSQAPKGMRLSLKRKVSLSAPALASPAAMLPRRTATFSFRGTWTYDSSATLSASATALPTSRPRSAAGTSPKKLSAL